MAEGPGRAEQVQRELSAIRREIEGSDRTPPEEKAGRTTGNPGRGPRDDVLVLTDVVDGPALLLPEPATLEKVVAVEADRVLTRWARETLPGLVREILARERRALSRGDGSASS